MTEGFPKPAERIQQRCTRLFMLSNDDFDTRRRSKGGMEFLYNLNRFNVATSRARCACIVAGSPRLFSSECRTPRQMELANVLCRYAEMSEIVAFGSPARIAHKQFSSRAAS